MPKGQRRTRLAFLCSHRGSTFNVIAEACRAGRLQAEPVLVLSNNRDAQCLELAREARVPAVHRSGKTHPDPAELDAEICAALESHKVDLVILAGYMKKIGPRTLGTFRGRILNSHPALLPRFGGPGMYGIRVHEAVLEAGSKVTGATIHLVDEEYDTGPVVAQREIPVLPDDTPDSLAARVLTVEHELYVDAIRDLAKKLNADPINNGGIA